MRNNLATAEQGGSSDSHGRLVAGRFLGAYGTRGWVRLRSYTHPPENLLNYRPWWPCTPIVGEAPTEKAPGQVPGNPGPLELLEGRRQGKDLVARLAGVTDRVAAEALRGVELGVERACLPPPEPDRYYWCDLLGLTVLDGAGRQLGRVTEIMETGTHDVLRVQGKEEHLVPMVPGVFVTRVDLAHGRIHVRLDQPE